MFTLKITHGEDTRRFPFAEVTWPALQQEVLKRFGIAPTPPFVLKYVDNEGDVLTVSNDGDLQEALSSAKQMSTSVIKFTLAFSDLPPNKGMEKEEEEEEERRRLELLKLQAEAEERRRVEEEMRLKEEEEKRKAEEEEERKRLEEEMRLKEEEERKKAEEEKKRFEQEMRLKEEEEKRRKAEEEEERREKKREVERKFAEARRQLEEEERLKQQEEESKRIQFVQSPSSSSTSPALPANVMCDQCRQVVKGVFFHCGHCPDFDLCEACEKTPHKHSPDHLFIKIPFPIDQSSNPWLHHRILLPSVNPPASLQPQPPQPCPKPEPESKAQSEPSCLISSTESTTSSPFLCHFLRDVTIPDGTLLPPNTSFVKTWALKNKGSNNWPLGTRLVQVGSEGCPILGPKMIPVEAAFPGQELQVSVHLETPKELGRSSLRWRLETPEGLKFGHVLWVDVVVDSPLPEEEEPQEEEEQEEQLQEQEQKKEEQEQEQLQEESLNNSSLSAPSSLILDFSDLTSSQQFYNEEMKALVSMGFCDRTNNLRLLRKHSGDLQLVLGDILQDPWFH